MKSATKAVLALVLVVVLGVAGWMVWNRFRPGSMSRTFAAGTVAPDFELLDQDGKSLRLASLRGQKVLIDFYKGYY